MARTYINSIADFHQILQQTAADIKKLVAQYPNYPPYDSLDMQLDAMRRWTANGRTPTADERQSIAIGQVLVRELEPSPDAETEDMLQRLYELNGYFKQWPDGP